MASDSGEILWRDFYGLHRTGWGDRLVPEAMAHPAKVRPDLAQKIVSHALAEGWWRKGDTLVEPFMGIGGFGLVGGWNGLRVVGVELEEHFVKLAEANIALHEREWGRDGCVRPVVVQGDSRELRRLVGDVMGSLSSPPYADTQVSRTHMTSNKRGDPSNPQYRPSLKRKISEGYFDTKLPYGTTAGQLGNERAETFWQALRVIASELHALLPPGAVSAWVVKDFVRNKARVPFCDDCATLLTQCGFTVFERWRCWMVSKAKQEDMFTGEVKPQRENKGFFRRLAEATGMPRIDFEEVIWFVRNDMPLFQET